MRFIRLVPQPTVPDMSQRPARRQSAIRNLRFLCLAAACAVLICSGTARAATYYWDNDGTTAGFGTASGTWAAPTTGNSTQGWSTNATGVLVPGNVTTLIVDALNFGNGATGLASGTISVSGTVNAGNITFASGSGAITLSGGTAINLAATQTITVNNASDTIATPLTGAGTSLTKAGTGELVLNGASTRASGGATLSAGTLKLGSTSALGTTAMGTFLLAPAVGGSPTTLHLATDASVNAYNCSTNSALSPTTIVSDRATAGAGITHTLGTFSPTSQTITIAPGSNVTSGTAGIAFGAVSQPFNGDYQINSGASLTMASISVVTVSSRTATFNATGDATITGVAANGAGVLSIAKNNSGTLTLNGANTYTGTTTVNDGTLTISGSPTGNSAMFVYGGTLNLDYGTNPTTSKINDSAILTLGGGTLNLSGGSHTEIVASTTLTASSSFLTQSSGSGVLQMGAITRSNRSSLNVDEDNIATTTTAPSNSILRGVTVGSGTATQFATKSGSNIVGLTGTAAAGVNNFISATDNYEYSLSGGTDTLTANRTANSAHYTGSGETIDLGTTGANTLTLNALMNAGTGPLVIQRTGGTGTVIVGSAAELILDTANSGITISAPISSAGGVTKTGSGTLTLSGANTYDGVTTVTGGTLSTGATGILADGGVASAIGDASLAANNLVLNGGTLQYANTGAAQSTNRLFTITSFSTTSALDASGTNMITFSNTGAVLFTVINTTQTLNLTGSGTGQFNPILGNSNFGATSLTKAGSGTWTLHGTKTYTGLTTVSAGTLAESSTGLISDSSALTVNGATAIFDLGASHSDTVAAVILDGGGQITGSGSSALTGTSYDVRSGSVSAILAGVGIVLTKTTAGTVTLSGANTYTGTTTVSSGTLLANTAVLGTDSATGTGVVAVNLGGTLGGTGQITPTGANGIDVASGGTIAPGASIGTLTFNLGSTSGDIAMLAGSGFEFELGTPNGSIGSILLGSSDLLVILNAVAGDMDFTGNDIDLLGTASGTGFYKLFDTSFNSTTWTGLTLGSGTTGGTYITGGLSVTNLGAGSTGSLILADGSAGTSAGDIYLSVTSEVSAVPEPSTYALGLIGLAGLGLLAWRRQTRISEG